MKALKILGFILLIVGLVLVFGLSICLGINVPILALGGETC